MEQTKQAQPKKDRVSLPLTVPPYSTYHAQGIGGAVLASNPTIRNWYLSLVMELKCTRRFLEGYGSPELDILRSSYREIPWIIVDRYPMRYQGDETNRIICDMLSDGYYVAYGCVDDFFIRGKSFYGERHFLHDGLICGFDSDKRTFRMYAYDQRWIYRTFDIAQADFERGRQYAFDQGIYGSLDGILLHRGECRFRIDDAVRGIAQYLNSFKEDYFARKEGDICGCAVQEFLILYLNLLLSGEIDYKRTDPRIFRLLWEHKKVMSERLVMMEKTWEKNHAFSTQYQTVVEEANRMRMLYASYLIKQRRDLLETVKAKLRSLCDTERTILESVTEYGRSRGDL